MKTPEQWIADYLDGTLDDAGQMTLAAWLREKPENMRAFVDCNRFDQQVRQSVLARAQREAAECFQQDTGEPRTSLESITGRPQTGKPSHRFLAVSAMAAAVTLGFFVWHQSGSVIPGGSSSPGPIARVTFLNGTQSATESPRFTIGQALTPGRLTLGAGAMELTMENGVNIVFEGPGELQLIDPMHAALHSGQAVVEVPPNAIGFHLETPAAEIIDLGTEFAAKVGPGLTTDVQVFDGKVVTTPKGLSTSGFPQQITAGNAVRFDPGSQSNPSPLPYVPERFLRSLSVTPPISHDQGPSEHFNTASHEEIESLPVTSAPVIDGDLSDWTDAGTFRVQREGVDGGNYYLEGRLRYDKDFLYVAARIGDPSPLSNIIRPDRDPEFAWRGGAVQIRLAADADLGWPVEGNAPAYFRFRKIAADRCQPVRPSGGHTLTHGRLDPSTWVTMPQSTIFRTAVIFSHPAATKQAP